MKERWIAESSAIQMAVPHIKSTHIAKLKKNIATEVIYIGDPE